MNESTFIHKSHNVSVLIYHLVTPSKYRRVVFDKSLDTSLTKICLEIEKRYEIRFLEIGSDKAHVHFLLQSVPTYSPSKIVQTVKSITAKEMFNRHPELRSALWGSEFWTKGYCISSVGKHGDEQKLRNYVRNQGSNSASSYEAFHTNQLKLF